MIARAKGANDAYYKVSSKTDAVINVDTHWALYQYASGAYPNILDATLEDDTPVYKAIQDGTLNDYDGVVTWDKAYPAAEFRDLLWAEMEGGVSGNPTAQGEYVAVNDVDNKGKQIENFILNDAEHMRPGVNYILVVAAKNQQGGSPVFSAISGIHYADFEYPRVQSVSTEGSYDAVTGIFNGYVTVTFDKPLRVLETKDGKTLHPYIARKKDAVVTGSGSASVQVQSSSVYGFTIMATNFPLNGTIRIVPSFYSNGATVPVSELLYSDVGTPRPSPFSLRLNAIYNDENVISNAEFVIADGGIGDGLKSETNIP